MRSPTIVAPLIAIMLAATCQAQNGKGSSSAGGTRKPSAADQFRARAARRAGGAGGRHVGPQFDGRRARPDIHDRDRPEDARRRGPMDRDTPGAGDPAQSIDDPSQRRDRELRHRFRQQLADIDALRDAALERGDLETLRWADALEQQVRGEMQRQAHALPAAGHAGQEPPGRLGRSELPPQRDPQQLPPGQDPDWLPPGIDPADLPPGLLRAIEQRFHGRLMHQGTLPPGQEAPGAGLPGRLAPLVSPTSPSSSTSPPAASAPSAPPPPSAPTGPPTAETPTSEGPASP